MDSEQKTKFKETEIGKIPEDWEVKRIRDLVKINELGVNKNYPENMIEYIDISSVDKGRLIGTKYFKLQKAPSRAKRIVRDNDILISTVRPNLKHFYFVKKSKKNLVASTGFAVISPKTINPKFLYYYLTTDRYTEYLTAIADVHTSTYPSYNPDIIDNSYCPYPGIEEQSAIAKILSDLDEKIELNQQMNRILESIGQAFFKRWFIDFEFPDEAGKPYKSSGGKMVHSDELGKKIPMGWNVVKYSGIVDYVFGFPFNSKLFNENKEGFPIIRIRDLSSNCTSFYTTEKYNQKYVIKAGDLVVGMDGEFRAYIWEGKDVLLNQRIVKISPKYDFIPPSYVYWATIRPLFSIESTKTGTTVIHLNKQDLDSIKVILPDTRILKLFGKYCDELIKLQINSNLQSITLETIRDALLPKLISGKIRVNVPKMEEAS